MDAWLTSIHVTPAHTHCGPSTPIIRDHVARGKSKRIAWSRVGGCVMPAKGVGIGAAHKPMAEYRRTKTGKQK